MTIPLDTAPRALGREFPGEGRFSDQRIDYDRPLVDLMVRELIAHRDQQQRRLKRLTRRQRRAGGEGRLVAEHLALGGAGRAVPPQVHCACAARRRPPSGPVWCESKGAGQKASDDHLGKPGHLSRVELHLDGARRRALTCSGDGEALLVSAPEPGRMDGCTDQCRRGDRAGCEDAGQVRGGSTSTTIAPLPVEVHLYSPRSQLTVTVVLVSLLDSPARPGFSRAKAKVEVWNRSKLQSPPEV